MLEQDEVFLRLEITKENLRDNHGDKERRWTTNIAQGRPATGDNRNSEKANKWTWLDIQNYRC